MSWKTVPGHNFGYAKTLRRESTLPERLLWNALRAGSMSSRFRRQHPIGPYIVDFYCRAARLVIEVDSDLAHGSAESFERDRLRERYLASRGLRMLHIRAEDLLSDLTGAIDAIRLALTPLNPPVKRGETRPEVPAGPD